MKTCGQVMSRDPKSCVSNESAQQAAQMMKREDVGAIPVVQDQQNKTLIGIVTDRDLALNVVADGRDARVTRVQDVMTTHPVTCHENDDLNKAMDAMAAHQVRRIPIVDNNNHLIGIVAQADIAKESNAPKKTAEVVEKISQSNKPAMHWLSGLIYSQWEMIAEFAESRHEQATHSVSSGGKSEGYMHFKQGVKVVTSDGQNSGTVDRVVLDPRTKKVTDVVVHKGFILPEDKVVPIQHVVEANDQQVVLKDTAERVKDLPPFEEKYYVPSNDEIGLDYTTGYARPIYGYPPVGPLWPNGSVLAGKIETQQNIPPNTVTVKEGARVISQDGKHVGNVERVILDEPTKRMTHIVASEGLLHSRKLIPESWIQQIDAEGVKLAVGHRMLDALAPYQSQDATAAP